MTGRQRAGRGGNDDGSPAGRAGGLRPDDDTGNQLRDGYGQGRKRDPFVLHERPSVVPPVAGQAPESEERFAPARGGQGQSRPPPFGSPPHARGNGLRAPVPEGIAPGPGVASESLESMGTALSSMSAQS